MLQFICSRWHLGDCHKDCLPTSRGFDEFRGETPGVLHYFDYSKLPMVELYGIAIKKGCTIDI